jgi:hypothetical protein
MSVPIRSCSPGLARCRRSYSCVMCVCRGVAYVAGFQFWPASQWPPRRPTSVARCIERHRPSGGERGGQGDMNRSPAVPEVGRGVRAHMRVLGWVGLGWAGW